MKRFKYFLFLKLFSLRGKQSYMLYRKHVIWKKIITATLFSCGTHCLDSSKVQKRITTHAHTHMTHLYQYHTQHNTMTNPNRGMKHVSLRKCGKKIPQFNTLPPLSTNQGQRPVSYEYSIHFSPYILSSSGYLLSNKCFN